MKRQIMFEKVNPCHPDKVADRIAGAIVDLAYTKNNNPKVAVEVLLGHGKAAVMIESSEDFRPVEIDPIVRRLAGDVELDLHAVKQDPHLANNQEGAVRCGDNGIFKGCPPTEEQRVLTAIAATIYERWPYDGKYILNTRKKAEHFDEDYCIYGGDMTICQSHVSEKDLKRMLNDFFMEDGMDLTHMNPEERRQKASGMQDSDGEHSEVWGTMIDELYHIGVIKGTRKGGQMTLDSEHMYELEYHINPLGEWTGGPDVDCGATNRKLGSDMGDGVTGGGLHGKDLSKADVSVNIWCYLESIRTGHQVTASCSIGDETVKVWSSESNAESHSSIAESRQSSPIGNGIPYKDIVEQARLYIHTIGGFEKFAEWGLIRAKDV